MRETLPSVTAMLVAVARGAFLGAPPPFDRGADPIAERLLPAPFAVLTRSVRQLWRSPAAARMTLQTASLGLAEHVALRTAAIDDVAVQAVRAGIDQIVILGAGLDARAFRLNVLHNVTVFEVDHPATQRWKRRRVVGIPPCARSISYVPVDFRSERLGDALASAAHDPTRPTLWIWEGVTMYLPASATAETLRELAARSSPGSTIALTYATPESVARVPLGSTVGLSLAAWVGEPFQGIMTTSVLHALLGSVGFSVTSDDSTREWAERYWPGVPIAHLRSYERLAVASRSETPASADGAR